MKPSEHRGFNKLHAEWTRKLRASGFKDIENAKGDIRSPHHVAQRTASRGRDSGGPEYYRHAGRWLWERVWPSRRDRWMWDLHQQGIGAIDISHQLPACMPARGEEMTKAILRRTRIEMGRWLAAGGDDDEAIPSAFEDELRTYDYVYCHGDGFVSGESASGRGGRSDA